MKMMIGALFLLVGISLHAESKLVFSEHFSSGTTDGWENKTYFKKLSSYTVEHEGTNFFVHASAEKTCSALTKKLNIEPSGKMILRWRWKISGVETNGSERDIKKFDHTARVFVAFDTFIGPPRTLVYFWGNTEKAGTVLAHPKSERAQMFILESGNARAGQWVSEERDLTADWQNVFPDRAMPRIIGVGLMTDSDSLGRKLEGFYGDLELRAE